MQQDTSTKFPTPLGAPAASRFPSRYSVSLPVSAPADSRHSSGAANAAAAPACRRIAQERIRPLLRELVGQRDKLPCLLPRRQRRAGGKIIDRPGLRLPGLKTVEHHAVGKELEIIQRQDITPAALTAADITVGLQQIIRLSTVATLTWYFRLINRYDGSGCPAAISPEKICARSCA